MKEVWKKTHFDKEKQPKTLQISYNAPVKDAEHGYVKEGSVIISILCKENSQGFSLTTGDVADVLFVFEKLRAELLKKTVSLHFGNDNGKL
jgi:hypothetical protein